CRRGGTSSTLSRSDGGWWTRSTSTDGKERTVCWARCWPAHPWGTLISRLQPRMENPALKDPTGSEASASTCKAGQAGKSGQLRVEPAIQARIVPKVNESQRPAERGLLRDNPKE